uniref:Uncharacterized protein n=1 Tax=Arundo donax TaxID=35708 RepID=A0A0A8ZXI2_ARUDO
MFLARMSFLVAYSCCR